VLELAPLDDHLGRAGAAGFLGIVSWSEGDLDRAARFWAECRAGLLGQGHIADVQGTTIALSDILMTQGRLNEAARICEEALALAMDGGRPTVRGVADTHASLCTIHLERGELDAAREHLARSAELGEIFGLPQFPYRSRVAQARLEIAEGSLDSALLHLREAERRYVSDFFPQVRPIPAITARAAIRLGRLEEAGKWARDAGVNVDDAPNYLREYEHITLARLHLAQASADASHAGGALTLLDRLQAAAEAGGRWGTVVEISILQAIAHRLLNNPPAALDAIRRALHLAAPETFSRPFVEEAESLSGLLKLVARRDGSTAFLDILLGGAAAPSPVASRHPDLIEPLSEREIDVLRLLRSDLSGPDIARELAVSLNTMRTHTKNIFDKLGVNSRRAAVRRAEDMRLFDRERSR
jgi:LuxR family maltose regulon positive regulatory protein